MSRLQPQQITAKADYSGCRIAIVAARWNDEIVQKLIDGTLLGLEELKVDATNIALVRCPGSYEIPLIVKRCAQSKRFDAVIALGVVIRGDTFHFELVAQAASEGIMQAMMETGLPCIFGVLTTDTMEQALARAGSDKNNKGYEAAHAACEMISVMSQL